MRLYELQRGGECLWNGPFIFLGFFTRASKIIHKCKQFTREDWSIWPILLLVMPVIFLNNIFEWLFREISTFAFKKFKRTIDISFPLVIGQMGGRTPEEECAVQIRSSFQPLFRMFTFWGSSFSHPILYSRS